MTRYDVDVPITLFYTVEAEDADTAEMNAWAEVLKDLAGVLQWDCSGAVSISINTDNRDISDEWEGWAANA